VKPSASKHHLSPFLGPSGTNNRTEINGKRSEAEGFTQKCRQQGRDSKGHVVVSARGPLREFLCAFVLCFCPPLQSRILLGATEPFLIPPPPPWESPYGGRLQWERSVLVEERVLLDWNAPTTNPILRFALFVLPCGISALRGVRPSPPANTLLNIYDCSVGNADFVYSISEGFWAEVHVVV